MHCHGELAHLISEHYADWLLWPIGDLAAAGDLPALATARADQVRGVLAGLAALGGQPAPDADHAAAFLKTLSWAPEGAAACATRLAALSFGAGPSQAVAEGLILLRSVIEHAVEVGAVDKPAWLPHAAEGITAGGRLKADEARELTTRLGSELGRLPGVAAVVAMTVGREGAVAAGGNDEASGARVAVFVESSPPPLPLRLAALDDIADSPALVVQADRADLLAVKRCRIAVSYRPLPHLLDLLESDSALPEDFADTLAPVQAARPLHDPDNLMPELAAALEEIPTALVLELARAFGAKARAEVKALQGCIDSGDPIPTGVHLGEAVRGLCRIVAVGNRRYAEVCRSTIGGLPTKPDRFYERLTAAAAAAGNWDALPAFCRELTSLADEALDLIR